MIKSRNNKLKNTKTIRKTKQRKRQTGSTTNKVAVLKCPFPQRMFTQLVYYQEIDVNPASFFYSYQFNLNSLYDPDRTGIGHSPHFYDQLTGGVLYNRYRVHACQWEMLITGLDVASSVVCLPMNGLTAPSTMAAMAESPYASTTVINAISSGGKILHKFKKKMKISTIIGEKLNDDRDQALYNANPVNSCVLHTRVETLDGTNLTRLHFQVRLRYFCELFDLNPVDAS